MCLLLLLLDGSTQERATKKKIHVRLSGSAFRPWSSTSRASLFCTVLNYSTHSLLCSVATFLMTMMAGFRKPPPPHHCTHTTHRSDGTLGAHLQQGGSRRSSPFLRSVRPPQKPHGHGGDSDSGCCDDDDDQDGDDCFALTKRFFFCFAFSPRPPPRLSALTHLFFHFI